MRRWIRTPRAITLVVAVVLVVTAAVLVGVTIPDDPATLAQPPSTSRPTSPSSTVPTSRSNSTEPAVDPVAAAAARRARLRRLVAHIVAAQPRHSVSLAAVDTASGATFSAGEHSGMWTASAYKLLVLETLLLERGAPLSGYESDEAVPMIENSDNKAGYSLYLAAGGCTGLQNAVRRFTMTRTVPACNDPTFTKTGAQDYLQLLRNLVDPDSPLTRSARRYALALMSRVEADQRWGVGVVADRGSVFYNKNGWLSIDDDNEPGEQDDGLWAVTSVGIVRVHGARLLMAVFTQHQPNMAAGVRLVQRLAEVAARELSPGA